jgi:hypothetical protein
MQLTDLPYTLFLEIISYLPPTDAVSCRLVSRRTKQALTRNDLSISLILLHFPRSVEGRLLRGLLRDGNELDDEKSHSGRELQDGDWAKVFARLARRYHHLGNAMAWRTTKVRTLGEETGFFRGVTPWNRFLRLEGRTAPFHYWDPVWSFSPKDGLLVYPEADHDGTGDAEALSGGTRPVLHSGYAWCPYRVRDLVTGREVAVPFDVEGKVVRRVRLNDGILMFEWCESEAFHALNEREAAHRHFATAYDVRRKGRQSIIPMIDRSTYEKDSSSSSAGASWSVAFRSEWKIHYLGLPLSHHDRFYSTHNSTHYVIYIWQPTRSPWGEENPLERLIIWEIGAPSPYRPSQDPGERSKPTDGGGGPRIIRRLINEELHDWDIRQKDTPSLRGLALDECTWDEAAKSACGHVFFHEEDHRWAAGPHSTLTPPRIHRVTTTGIPLVGDGPRWMDECGGGGDDEISMSFCWRGPQRRAAAEAATAHAARSGWSRGCSSLEAAAAAAKEEAWLGRAPCWRHDDFPYLTVSEVFDAAAGVRVSARQCFMMETLSVHVRPRLRVQGVEATTSSRSRRRRSRSGDDNDRTHSSSGGGANSSRTSSRSGVSSLSSSARRRRHQNGDGGAHTPPCREEERTREDPRRAEGPDGEEVQFADEVWEEMMGKGYICGDERWLVGEDRSGAVTVLEF